MKRIIWIDTLKGLAILLVIMGHVCQMRFPVSGKWLANIIYSFHMPLFLFLSGLFARKAVEAADKRQVKSFIIKKAKQLLVPFIIWMGLWCIIKGDAITMFLDGGFIYWYLPTLFEFLLLFCILRYLSNSIKLNQRYYPVLLFLSILSLYQIPGNCLVGRLLRIGYSSYFYIFFVLGYLFDRYCIQKVFTPPILLSQIKGRCVTKHSSLIAHIGMNTMGIYLIHYYFVLLIPKWFDFQIKDCSDMLYLLLCLSISLVIIFLCMVTTSILKKYKISQVFMLGIIK